VIDYEPDPHIASPVQRALRERDLLQEVLTDCRQDLSLAYRERDELAQELADANDKIATLTEAPTVEIELPAVELEIAHLKREVLKLNRLTREIQRRNPPAEARRNWLLAGLALGVVNMGLAGLAALTLL